MARAKWWWWRNEGEPSRDVVDVGFKLRSLRKIAFDINARRTDNKIKS